MSELLTIIESDKNSELAYLQQLTKVLEVTNQLHKARLDAVESVKTAMVDVVTRIPDTTPPEPESYTDTHTTAPYV